MSINYPLNDAKTNLSRLIAAIERGRVTEIVITRNGRAVARLMPIDRPLPKRQAIAVAKGVFTLPTSFDDDNNAISE